MTFGKGLKSAEDTVSIHATLAGGDGALLHLMTVSVVSIHATLAGGDTKGGGSILAAKVFLSTPPSRVATWATPEETAAWLSFYPRHPRGWRPRLCTPHKQA